MKSISTLLAVFACGSIFASQPETQKPTQSQKNLVPIVTLEAPNYCFAIDFTGSALVPYANNLDYAAEALPFNYGDTQPAVSPSWYIPTINPNFNFGFDVALRGIIQDVQASLNLDWQRFHSNHNTASFQVSDDSYMVGPFYEIGPDASAYKKSKGSVDFHFDQVNLNYGTFVRFGNHLYMNLFTGVSYARIHETVHSEFSDVAETVIRKMSIPSKFQGAGPQVGTDFQYKIYEGLELVGNIKTALFVGNFHNHTEYSTQSSALTSLGDQNPNNQKTNVSSKSGIVPSFEGKLGLAYEYCYLVKYFFQLEAGYQAQIYLSAIRSTDLASEVALGTAGSVGSAATGVYARTFQRVVSDFGLSGPYAKIVFGF